MPTPSSLFRFGLAALIGVGTGLAISFSSPNHGSGPTTASSPLTAKRSGDPSSLRAARYAHRSDGKGNRLSAIATLRQILKDTDTEQINRELYLLLPTLSGDELKEVIPILFADSSQPMMSTIYIARLGEIDMGAAMALIEEESNAPQAAARRTRYPLIYIKGNLLSQWIIQDEPSAQAWYDALPEGKEKKQLRGSLISGLAERHPDRALALLRENPKESHQFFSSLSTLMESAPEQTLQAIRSLPEGQTRQNAERLAFGQWIILDPLAAEAALHAMPAGSAKTNATMATAQWLIMKDPVRAFELLKTAIPKDEERLNHTRLLIQQWAHHDREAALAYAATLPELQNDPQWEHLSSHSDQRPPEERIEAALQMPEGQKRNTQLSISLQNWINTDPETALEWMEKNPASVHHPDVLRSTFFTLAHSDAAAAVNILERMPEGDERANRFQNLGQIWAQSDLDASKAYLEKLPDGPDKERFSQGLISALASQDPAEAARQMETIDDPKLKAQLFSQIANEWAGDDPQAAIRWVLSQPPDERSDQALGTIAQQWSQFDQKGATEWVETIPPSPTRDKVVTQLAQSLTSSDPAEAAHWALLIEDPKQQTSQLRNVFRNWKRFDEAGAAEWLEQAELPEDTRKAIQR